MRVRASQNHGLKHARQYEIVRVESASGDVARTFLAARPIAYEFFCFSHNGLKFEIRNLYTQIKSNRLAQRAQSPPRFQTSTQKFLFLGVLGAIFLKTSIQLQRNDATSSLVISFLPFCCILHRFDDLHVSRTHAQISRQCFAYLLFRGIRMIAQKRVARHHHSWSAVPALKSVMLDKRVLHRIEVTVACETFDGRNLAPVRLNGEVKAGFYQFTVEQIEQAPHSPTTQPTWVPVRPSFSRIKCNRQQARLDVFLVTLPFTVTRTAYFMNPNNVRWRIASI